MRMFWNANSTLLASRAEVSIKDRLLSPEMCQHWIHRFSQVHVLANCLASSVGTALKCLKSLLFPTSMITMFESA